MTDSVVSVQTATFNPVVISDNSLAVTQTTTREFVTQSPKDTVFFQTTSSQVIQAGQLGPKGQDGVSEDLMIYAKRVDFVGDSVIYRGEAEPGTQEDQPLWRIRKISIVNEDVSETWANGQAEFTNVWLDREALEYS